MKNQFEKYDKLRQEHIKLQGDLRKSEDTVTKLKEKLDAKTEAVNAKAKPTATDNKTLKSLKDQHTKAKKSFDDLTNKEEKLKKDMDAAYKSLQTAASKETKEKKEASKDKATKDREKLILRDQVIGLVKQLGSLIRIRDYNSSEQEKLQLAIDKNDQALKSPRAKRADMKKVVERVKEDQATKKEQMKGLIAKGKEATKSVESCMESIEESSKELAKLTGVKQPSLKEILDGGARIPINSLLRPDFENFGYEFIENDDNTWSARKGKNVVTAESEEAIVAYLQSAVVV